MCLATPAKIISLNGDIARVDLNGIEFDVYVSFLEAPAVGDWVVVHTGVALSKVDKEQLDFWNKSGGHDELS